MARHHLFEHTSFQRYSRWFAAWPACCWRCFFGIAEIKQWQLQQEADHVLLDAGAQGFGQSSSGQSRGGHRPRREESGGARSDVPWPRYQVASLIQHISKAKPSAIGLDLMFPEADRTSLINIQSAFKRDFGLDIGV